MKAATTLAFTGARRGSLGSSGPVAQVLRRRSSIGGNVPSPCVMNSSTKRSSYYLRSASKDYSECAELEAFDNFQIKTIDVTTTNSNKPMSKEGVKRLFEDMPKPQVSADLPCEMVFLGGAPGAGKGTNSLLISSLRGHTAEPIVVSSLLNTPECKALKDQGKMVDDAFVFDLLMKEVKKPAYRNGVVVDGFPRTSAQAEFLKKMHNEMSEETAAPPQFVFVMLHVDEAASISRQLQRGEFIKLENAKREKEGLDPLELRVTDSSYESAKARYTVFEEQLNAIMNLGKKFNSVIIDASSTIENVRQAINTQLSVLPKA